MKLHNPELKAVKFVSPHNFDKVEKVRVNILIPRNVLNMAREYKLNISRIATNSIICFVENRSPNPKELMETMLIDSFDKQIDHYNKSMPRYDAWIKGVIIRRYDRQKSKYEHIGGIIKEKKVLDAELWDNGSDDIEFHMEDEEMEEGDDTW